MHCTLNKNMENEEFYKLISLFVTFNKNKKEYKAIKCLEMALELNISEKNKCKVYTILGILDGKSAHYFEKAVI